MKFLEVAQEVIDTKTLTPTLEAEINTLLWSQEFDSKDVAALEQLVELLSEGIISQDQNSLNIDEPSAWEQLLELLSGSRLVYAEEIH